MVAQQNINDRISQYKNCVEFYLEQTNLPIYFLDNSDYNFTTDADFVEFQKNPRFKLLQFSPHPDKSKGKGHQEFYVLDKFVKEHFDHDLLIKVTGRYVVKNVAKILENLSAPLHFDLHRKMKVAITGFFVVEKQIYLDHFYGKYTLVNDPNGKFIEHVIYDEIMSSALKSKNELFPYNPVYEGVSGSYGGSLSRNKYKMMVRQVERKINRNLGINQFLIEY